MRVKANERAPAGFPLGLLAFSLALAMYKAVLLSWEMTSSLNVLPLLLGLDLAFLAMLALTGVAHSLISNARLRLLLKGVLVAGVAFYLVHSFVLLALDESMNLFDLARYLPEARVVGSFFDVLTILAILVFIAAALLWHPPRRKSLAAYVFCAALGLGVGLLAEARSPPQLDKYGVLRMSAMAGQLAASSPVSAYTPEQAAFYSSAGPGPVELPPGQPDVILLIVESLSSINSRRVSGERNLLTAFDEISARGTLFVNFFANHAASEGGIISLLSGFPPLHYPTATPLMFDEFAMQDSVIAEYRSKGYYTEFLTNAGLSFIGLERYISGLEFDLARGRDEVPSLALAPRFVQDAPSDRHLYRVALDRTDEQAGTGQPWLFVMATVSTHLPYRHPEGGEDTAGEVWSWALSRLQEFLAALEERDFLDRGIILVTGDHRQMRPLSRQETDRYGDSAKARIPLLAIGQNFTPGAIDERFFQQADLLRLLGRAGNASASLSPNPVWVERYNRIYGKVQNINRFSVFEQSNDGRTEYPVQMSGANIEWLAERPEFARAVEARVHGQRSRHQLRRNGRGSGCSPPGEWRYTPSDRQGLKWIRFDREKTTGPQASGSGRLQADRLLKVTAEPDDSRTSRAQLHAYLEIDTPGTYWFRTADEAAACLYIDGRLVVDQPSSGRRVQGSVELGSGLHTLEFRSMLPGTAAGLQWVTPGLTRWRWRDVPKERFRLPAPTNENRPAEGDAG